MNNTNNQLSFTVGIPTYYGGPALVRATKSILRSKNVGPFRLIVCIDGNPLDPKIEQQLLDLGVEVVFSKQRGGQVARLKQIISMTKTDLVVLTQDDIQFKPNTLANLLKKFDDEKTTLVAAKILPTKAKTFFERIIEVGVKGNIRLGKLWRDGDNYLLANGRCMVFKTKFVKSFSIREEVINSDAYFYFENKKHGGKFVFADDAVIFNKSPQKLSEHLKQSRKFQISQQENNRYLDQNLEEEYKIPVHLQANALLGEFFDNPVYTLLYLGVNLYTKIAGREMFQDAKRFWETDVSTKRI